MKKGYIEKVNSILYNSGIYFVVDDSQVIRDIVFTFPRIDARSLINSPGSDIADAYRDAVLAKLFGFNQVDKETLSRLFEAYLTAKRRVAEQFLEELSKEVGK